MNIKPHHCLSATLVVSAILVSWVLIGQRDNNQQFVNADTHINDIAAINRKLDELGHMLKYIETQSQSAEPAASKESQKPRSTHRAKQQENGTIAVTDEPAPVEIEQNIADGSDQVSGVADPKLSELEQMQNIVWHLERELGHQEDDTNWYPQAEDAIHSALDNKQFNQSSLANISCRSTMCRIDIAHANQDAEMVFLSEINAVAGFADTEAFYTREVDMNGGVLMTYYLSREGHRLPRLTAVN